MSGNKITVRTLDLNYDFQSIEFPALFAPKGMLCGALAFGASGGYVRVCGQVCG